MTTDFVYNRKLIIEYNRSVQDYLTQALQQIEDLGFDVFSYGRYLIDQNNHSTQLFWVKTHKSSFEWHCTNELDIGDDFRSAMENCQLNDPTFLIFPEKTEDTIIRTYRDHYGIQNGVTLYKRSKKHLEFFDFQSTHNNNVLSKGILPYSVMGRLERFAKEFELKTGRFEISKENTFLFPKAIIFGESSSLLGDLSPRELHCLTRWAQGQTIKEIANDLNLSPHTIQTYLKRIRDKTGLHSKAQLLSLLCP